MNLVVGPRDWPAAILIRGVEGAIGPGRVTKALGVDRRLNATSAADETNDLWLEDRGVRVPHRRMQAKPRVGVEYAGPIWSMKRWRFTFELPGRPQPHGQRPRLKSSPKSARAAGAGSAPSATIPIELVTNQQVNVTAMPMEPNILRGCRKYLVMMNIPNR